MEDNSKRTTPSARQSEPKIIYREKNRLSNIFTRTILTILLAAAGASLVWVWLQWREADSTVRTNKAELTQLSQDKSSLQQQLADNRAKSATGEEVSPNDQIIQTAKAYVGADVTVTDANSSKFEIGKQNGTFATVRVTSTAGESSTVLLKKSTDQWVALAMLKDTPSQEFIDRYGVPANFL